MNSRVIYTCHLPSCDKKYVVISTQEKGNRKSYKVFRVNASGRKIKGSGHYDRPSNTVLCDDKAHRLYKWLLGPNYGYGSSSDTLSNMWDN